MDKAEGGGDFEALLEGLWVGVREKVRAEEGVLAPVELTLSVPSEVAQALRVKPGVEFEERLAREDSEAEEVRDRVEVGEPVGLLETLALEVPQGEAELVLVARALLVKLLQEERVGLAREVLEAVIVADSLLLADTCALPDSEREREGEGLSEGDPVAESVARGEVLGP